VRIPSLHRWPRTTKAAIALQQKLASRVRKTPVRGTPRLFAGADATFTADGRFVIAGVVVWDRATGECVEQRTARVACHFPYVPGLLSFREIPGLLAAFRRLHTPSEVVLCDAHGYAHPRRFGLACHVGLWLDRPTIGVAKSRLCGEHGRPGVARGGHVPLVLDGEQVGTVLRTRTGVKPVYISVGHCVDLRSAVRLTLAATAGFRLPEPARMAHHLVTVTRRAFELANGKPKA